MQYLCSRNGRDLVVNVEILNLKMRDGVLLHTQVLTPEKPGKYPIVFVRNPYVSEDFAIERQCGDYFSLLAGGYALVYQHCRGCGRSGGDIVPYLSERADGLDTLEHIRRLDCYNGEIYLHGGSYLSSVHFSYLDTAPSDIRGAILCVQDVNRYNILYRNGFYKSGLHGKWGLDIYRKKSIQKKNLSPDTFRTLPLLRAMEDALGEPAPQLENELRHPSPDDPFWQTPEGGSDYLHALDNLRIPVLLITAFHDIYTEGVFRMWERIPADNRRNCALIVTPYEHNYRRGGEGQIQFENGEINAVWPDLELNWFNSIRIGEPLRFARRGQTTWYDLFGGGWLTAPFLEPGKTPLRLRLHPELRLDPSPAPEQELRYLYNPFAPAAFHGGCCNNFGGMCVQDPPNSRYDILSFVSDPFDRELAVRGPGEIELRVRSDRPDTCFYARLSLVREGVAYGLRDDIQSISNFAPDYIPGNEVALSLRLTEHSFRVRTGDRLRLDVSSSCWPYFVPHTNRRGLYCEQTGADPAHNTVICGKSELILHIEP